MKEKLIPKKVGKPHGPDSHDCPVVLKDLKMPRHYQHQEIA
jgi:hypothetical protein